MRGLNRVHCFRRIAALVLLVATTAGAWAQDRPRIVAVNYPLQYFAERLAGDAADVVLPVPAGVDPSFWRPAIADISAIQTADLVLLNGAGFATWVDRVSLPRSRLVNTSGAIADRFIKTETITHSHGDGGEHSHEGVATYVWLDPTLAAAQAEAVAAAIQRRDLVPADTLDQRLADLLADLETLDSEARSVLAPARDVVLVTTHPRYQYLAGAYDLTVVSLEWEAGAVPGASDLAALEVALEGVDRPILIWESEPPAAATSAIAELGLTSAVFETLAMPPSDGTFIDSFRSSVAALAETVEQNPAN